MRFRASDVAAVTKGTLHGGDTEVDGVAIDSRLVRGGELFVPIAAERDGHDYIRAALSAGAAATLTARILPGDAPSIAVADTKRALLDIGHHARGRLGALVVGVTGSVGKTSVKDLTAAVLATRYRTAASERSFNNELGVPLTLANAPDGTQATVVEMGARGLDHITLLCEVARPTVGVVTAVAHAHTEMFGSIDEVAAAKAELVEALPAAGTAVLNLDDHRVAAMRDRNPGRTLTYSAQGASSADVAAALIVIDDALRPSFVLRSPWGEISVRLGVSGIHQVGNALAAAGAALACGVKLNGIAEGLEKATMSPWRMDLQTAPSGALVLNDAYNANPASMAAALRSLEALPARRRIAVLGLMAELGDLSPDAHARVITLAESLDIEVIAVDTEAYGRTPVRGVEGAVAALGSLGKGDAVLVKGSRVAGLERVAAALLEA